MKKIMQEKKEIVQGVLIVVGIIVLLGVLYFVSENIGDRANDKSASTTTEEETTNPLLEEGQVLNEEEMKEMEEISYADFEAYLKKKTTTVIMLGYDECYWCQQQKPILESLMYEKDLDVKYLNVNELSSDEYDELVALHEDLEGFGTPTFISVKNKKIVKVSANAKTKTELLAMFADMGILD